MRTDRELLELAAKAAGIVGTWASVHQAYGDLTVEGLDLGGPIFWNPQADDGDALRLARAIGLRVDFNYCTGADRRLGIAVWTPGDDCPYPPFWTLYGKRPDVDVRCTIVRAAASLAVQVSPPALNTDGGSNA